jgi:pentatricopeptide repeat domain-containing protein 1
MMAFSVLTGLPRRFLIRQQIVVASLRKVTNSNPSSPKVLSEFRLNDEDHDPDVFGTLSSVNSSKQKHHQFTVSPSIGSLMESKEEITDEGDAKEEEYLSFDPIDRKSFKEFEREVEQLVLKDKRLKEALQLLEVTMKQDKVKPSRDIYSMLIGACGKAGYTKKAFSLYNDVTILLANSTFCKHLI